MTCRRIRRQLRDRVRFGEVEDCSAAQLDHLDDCHGCRDEMGIDQAIVRQLRRALEARVAGSSPSPQAFAQIRQRALAETAAAVSVRDAPGSPWARLLRWHTPLRTLAAGSALALIAVVSSGQLNDLGRTATALPVVRWQGLVQSASLPVLEPWDMHHALGIAPPQRPSGLTPQADAVGVVAVIPNLPEPTAAGFFR